jgi:hypothetical protein
MLGLFHCELAVRMTTLSMALSVRAPKVQPVSSAVRAFEVMKGRPLRELQAIPGSGCHP